MHRQTDTPQAGRSDFAYDQAFSRTLGWITQAESHTLRAKRVAIAGAGGVGGVHLLTLARLGIGGFTLSDMDSFEQTNFNRQAGAMMSTVGLAKVDVMAAMARDINPELELRLFAQGICADNVDAFLDGADLYVDALDFFAHDARAAVFAACMRRGIPAITVAPAGMGASLVSFLPGQMSFEDYFGFAGRSDIERSARFLVGLSPRGVHGAYLIEPERVDLVQRRGPSTPMGVQLCAGVAGTEALKILLQRGRVRSAPHAISYDAFLNRLVITWRPGGWRNPLTRLKTYFVQRVVRAQMARSVTLAD